MDLHRFICVFQPHVQEEWRGLHKAGTGRALSQMGFSFPVGSLLGGGGETGRKQGCEIRSEAEVGSNLGIKVRLWVLRIS